MFVRGFGVVYAGFLPLSRWVLENAVRMFTLASRPRSTLLAAFRFTSAGEQSRWMDPRFREELLALPVPLSAGMYVCGTPVPYVFRKYASFEDSVTRILGD